MLDLWTILLGLCVLGLYILWQKTVRNATLPPGPPTVPFVGNLNLKLDNMPENFRNFRRTYGDVFSLILGSNTLVVVNGFEALKEVFVKNGDVTSERADSFITRELSHHKGLCISCVLFHIKFFIMFI